MRHQIIWILILFLAVPLLLSRLSHNQNAPRVESMRTPQPPSPIQKKVAAVTVQSEAAPQWELQFWNASAYPDWEQSEYLEDVAANIPDDQICGVLDLLLPEQSNEAHILIEMLAERWAQKSPADAARWAEKLPDGEFGQRVFAKVARQWALTDVSAAINWSQQLPEGENKTAAELSVAHEAASQQQAIAALTLLAKVPPGPDRDEAANYAAQQWAANDADAAIAWVNQLPDAGLREKILGQIAVNLGAQDPARAAQFIVEQLDDGAIRNIAVENVVRFWASSSPADAAAWIQTFPAGKLHDMAAENLMDVWTKNDNSGFNAWLTQQVAY